MPGAFKLGHLEQVGLILFWNFSKMFHLYTGGQFLLPQRANTHSMVYKGHLYKGHMENFLDIRGHTIWTAEKLRDPITHIPKKVYLMYG